VDHRFTFSIYTIEINDRPTLALQAKRHKRTRNGFANTAS